MSTATLLVDIATRATVANLEEFEVLQDGSAIKALDFNYWGMTFGRDSHIFYATLRTLGVNYLVRGDIRARTVAVVHKGVECLSLSPDETHRLQEDGLARRLAFGGPRSDHPRRNPAPRNEERRNGWTTNGFSMLCPIPGLG